MVNRILFGKYAGDIVFRVSKPLVDVYTAADKDLLINGKTPLLQVLQSGIVAGVLSDSLHYTASITFPDRGFKPIIFLAPGDANGYRLPTFIVSGTLATNTRAIYLKNLTNTSCEFWCRTWQSSSNTAMYFHYSVLNGDGSDGQ